MRKEKLTKEAVREAVKLVSSGASNKDVCAYIGVNETTFYRWLKDPKTDNQRQLCQSLKKAETERKLWHVRQIMQAAADGKWQASAWFLERKYPDEYGRPPVRQDDATAGMVEQVGEVMVRIAEAAGRARG